MANLGMGESPIELTTENIDKHVDEKRIGNYGLGYPNPDDPRWLYVQYVGRSDTDLRKRLKDHVGNYKHFKFCYLGSALDAWHYECQNYHDFPKSKTDNDIHPARPKGYTKENHPCNHCDK